ncbi:TPA: hypothetical protein EYP66_17160 [Candidatus Poribacteria bacterium]|nr:hypothetical protein [Candidatus Poribacteria bacterium]
MKLKKIENWTMRIDKRDCMNEKEQWRRFPNLRSSKVVEGVSGAYARSLYRAVGVIDSDFKKPLIAVANSWNEIVPGHPKVIMNLVFVILSAAKNLLKQITESSFASLKMTGIRVIITNGS